MTGVIRRERFLWTAWSEKASVLRTWYLSKNLNQSRNWLPWGRGPQAEGTAAMQRHRGGKSLRLRNAEGKGRERRARRSHPVCSPRLIRGPEERGDVTGSFQRLLWLPRREWDGIQGAREETKRQAPLSRPEATPSIQDTWYQSPGCCVHPASLDSSVRHS